MVEVLVRIDDEPNRLVGNPPDDLLDDREAARFAERRVEDDDERREFDGDAVVRPAADEIHAVGQRLGLDAHGKRGRAHGVWNGDWVRADVGLHVLERAAEGVVAGRHGLRAEVVVPPLMGMPASREPDPAAEIDVAVVGELVLVVHVAERLARDPGVNPLKQVLLVDGGVHAVLAPRDRHHAHPLGRHFGAVASHLAKLPAPDRLRIRTGERGRFQEAVRVQHEFDGIDLREL